MKDKLVINMAGLIAWGAVAAFSHGGETISLSMAVPDRPLLGNERFDVIVTVTNKSAGTFVVHANPMEAVMRSQLIFDYGTRFRIPDTERVREPQSWHAVTNRSEMVGVPRGEAFSWAVPDTLIAHFCSYYHASNISCRLMVGDGRWVSSPKYPVNVLEQEVGDVGVLKFSGEYVLRDGRVSTLRIYEVAQGTASYLFTESGVRLCRLPPDARPSFQMDRDAAVLTVTEPSFARPVRYFPNTLKIER